MSMSKQALLAELLRLPMEERIDFLGEAWDSIAASPEDVQLPEWHLREIERRSADANPQYVTWDEVRRRLRGTE
jgi:putative addiction module component (TIGR02574 family)